MDLLNIVGVVATVAAAFVTFYGTYASIKISKEKKGSDKNTTFLFTGHSKYTHNDNSINLNVDNKTVNYYDYVPSQRKGKKPKTKKEKIQSGLLEFVLESSILIKHLKLIAIGVSVVFTMLYLLLTTFDIHFFGTSQIEAILAIDDSPKIYVYVFLSLLLLIYSTILLAITAWYSKDFIYQADIRDFINIDDLTLFKQKLINSYKFSKIEEFPIRTIIRLIDNIRISHKNQKAYNYNNRVIHKPKKEILSYRSIIFDNVYFKIIAGLVILNIAYMVFYPSYKLSSPLPVFESNVTFFQDQYSKPYVLKNKITEANFRSSRSKVSRNIIRTIGRNEIFYSYNQSGQRWWKIKTQDGQVGYMHSATIKRY